MIIVDTSVWIPFFRADSSIFPSLNRLLEDQQILALECLFGELLQGAKDPRERQILVQYWKNLPKVEERGLWVEAGLLSSRERFFSKGIGLIDTFMVIVARRHRAKIWTLDKRLLSVLQRQEIYEP